MVLILEKHLFLHLAKLMKHNACSVIELSIEAVENVSEKAAELVTIINS